MEQFIFKGDWEFDLQLSMFMASNSNWGDHKRKTPELKPIRVVIKDEKNYDPDPIEEQIATVHYIMKNQMAVLNGLCSALDRINQQYAEWCGEDDWFPDKMSIATISDVLWISEITILTEHKDGRAYYEISCEYRGDLEHGLIIVMYDTRMLEHAPVGEVEYSELYKDLGELSAAQIEKNLQSNDFGLNQIHIPLPKYGKLKPWQEEAMSDYLSNLVRLKNNELLKEMINDDKFDINQRLDYNNRNLVDMAAYYGNTEMIEFLVERKADTSR
ncbi:MAG: hypothetical protein P1U56_21165, partial [Saprospiraceae bacterium]|nr:hypothetical protein [Saprospiraceae bacterium]